MNARNHLQKITTATLGLGLLLQGSLSWADDTEMFFGKLPANVKPNILFVLDNSGSMNMCLDSQARPCYSGESRLKTLQNTMNALLSDLKGVNVGLMTLRYDEHSTAPLHAEVKDIEETNVRTNIKNKINSLTASNWTPITGTLYDAARYLNADQPNYLGLKSPIVKECQPTHLVLLTDGQANKNSIVIRDNIKTLIQEPSCKERGSLVNSSIGGETCAVELVKWMAEKDQATKIQGEDNFITTHTIGYALDADKDNKASIQKFLEDLASAGNGSFYLAKDASNLSEAFKDIIRQATEVQNTSFANPSPAGGDFNSDKHKKQVYYGMFKPVQHDPWPGNLKRYGLRQEDKNLIEIDKNGNPSKDSSGEFKINAVSWWSNTADGNNVNEGGAARQLPAPDSRHLWTYIDGEMVQFPTTATINDSNSKITETLLNAKDKDERKKLLNYIRGFDNNKPRQALADPLHSAPTLFSYECQGTFDSKKCEEAEDKENTSQMAIIGTNEGFVHMFDTVTGIEQFAFMPEELLKNIKPIYEDSKTPDNIATRKPHRYGMDNTVTVWINDKNSNGKVDGDDKVYAYASMRRGGKSIYALDITDKNNPKLVWKISAGDTHFKQLGQTWSQPVKTKIKISSNEVKDVLIFGGGYDPAQDEPSNYKIPASQGNDIYIVNAKTGEFIWSANDSGFDMKYSIPGNIRVLSLDDKGKERADGLATQFFVGDVGGQVWRFIIENGELKNIKSGGEKGSGVLADLGGTNGNHDENARRFYHAPDVAVAQDKLFANIGSGYRAHPLDTVVKDRMYSIHLDLNLTNSDKTLTEADLSPQVAGKFNGEQTSADIKNGKSGWFIELQGLGEKIISTPKTIGGRVIFNTYTPPVASNNPCATGISENRTYDLQIEDAIPYNATKREGDYSDYASLSKAQGALGDPNVICFADQCWVQFGPGEFSDPFSRGDGSGRKIYWIDLAQ